MEKRNTNETPGGKLLPKPLTSLSPVPRADYTVKWFIDNLDASMRELSYVVDACDCASVGGSTETLASLVYVDDGNSPATIPTLPTSVSVQVVDPVETCGSPSVNLGKQRFD